LNSTFSNIDLFVLLIYLIASLGIGLYFSRRSDRNTEEYFLGGRSFGWFAIGLTLFATNISSEHFIGLAGSGASRGLAVGQFELMAIFILILLGWVLAPIYLKSGVMTMPEFLEKRFDGKIRKIFAVLSICIYLFTKISVTLFAGGVLFYKIFGFNIYASVIVIVLITGLYSLIGGSKAVIRTNVFQAFVLIMAWWKSGDFQVLLKSFPLITLACSNLSLILISRGPEYYLARQLLLSGTGVQINILFREYLVQKV
jgi:SSS family solute:Na+ symporter